MEDLRREINRRRAKEKEEKYNYLNNKVETRNVSNIRVKLKKMKLHDEEDKNKMNNKNKKKKKVSKNFWTDVISKKKLNTKQILMLYNLEQNSKTTKSNTKDIQDK